MTVTSSVFLDQTSLAFPSKSTKITVSSHVTGSADIISHVDAAITGTAYITGYTNAGTTLTVTAVIGCVSVGMLVTGITTPSTIASIATGSGGVGTYTLTTTQASATGSSGTPVTTIIARNMQSTNLLYVGWQKLAVVSGYVPGVASSGGALTTSYTLGVPIGTYATTGSTYSPMFQYVYAAPLADAAASATGSAITGTAFTTTGTFSVGQLITGTGVAPGTVIVSGAASPYTVNISQTVTATTITGYPMKYLIVRWDPLKQIFWTSTCEAYSLTSNTITNECWTNAGAFTQHYDVRDSFIWVNITNRHVVLWPFVKNEPNLWAGVFEFERVAPEDTVANNAPPWAWTNSLILGTPYGATNNTTGSVDSFSKTMLAFPRTGDGQTGAGAAQTYATMTIRGMFPPYYPQLTALSSATVATTYSTDTNSGHLGSYHDMTYGWDSSTAKAIASPISADAFTKSLPLGRMYCASITKPIGSHLDTINMTVDSAGGWASASGTATDCVILPLNGGYDQASSALPQTYATSHVSGPNKSGTVVINSTALAAGFTKVIAIGDTLWAACPSTVGTTPNSLGGVYTWNMNATGSSPVRILESSTGVFDILFDGVRSVYAATSAGITKIDTEVTANQYSLADTTNGGPAFLSMDNTYIYASTRTASTTPTVRVYAPGLYTAAPTLYSSYTPSATVGASVTFGTPYPDYNGSLFLLNTSSGTTLGAKVAKAAVASTTSTETYAASLVSGSGITTTQSQALYIDPLSGTIYFMQSTGTTFIMRILGTVATNNSTSIITAATTPSGMATGTITGSSSSSRGATGTADNLGELKILPYRGNFQVYTMGTYSVSGQNVRHQFQSPNYLNAPGGNLLLYTGATVSIADVSSGQVTGSFCNYMGSSGSRLYGSGYSATGTASSLFWTSNIYPLTNAKEGTTGRLLVKG